MAPFENMMKSPQSLDFLIENASVRLGARALELLIVLADANGSLVTKQELLERVWRTTKISENNLRVQMNCVRKALGGNRYLLVTESGRGYRLLSVEVEPTGTADMATDSFPA